MKLLTTIFTFIIFGLSVPSDSSQISLSEGAPHWIMNTSNPGKSSEYKDLLLREGITLSITKIDQDEIDADPLSVLVHKASQIGERILVDDTSLDVEGENVGVNLRWVIEDIPSYAGKKAVWRVLLGYREDNRVFVYSGEVKGTIVHPNFENDPTLEALFLPDDSDFTLNLDKPDALNPRALAIDAFINDEPVAVLPIMDSWNGPWQNH